LAARRNHGSARQFVSGRKTEMGKLRKEKRRCQSDMVCSSAQRCLHSDWRRRSFAADGQRVASCGIRQYREERGVRITSSCFEEPRLPGALSQWLHVISSVRAGNCPATLRGLTWPPLVPLKKRKHSGAVIFEGAHPAELVLPVARSNLGRKSKRAGPTSNSKCPLSRGEDSGQTLINSR